MNRKRQFFHGREMFFLGKTTPNSREDFKFEPFVVDIGCNISAFSIVKFTAETLLKNNRSQNDNSSSTTNN